MELHDTAGQEEFDQIRQFGYQGAQVILVCFAVNDGTTLQNIKAKWMVEIQTHAPTAKVVLVGTKADMRKVKSKMSVKRKNRSQRGQEVICDLIVLQEAL